ncbi:22470_t:CDS:2 [Cetraspora pellucida]|uniref:22470_t:CDS:1 n=1 Tax=Cetraspora pellucida TaxID=1433469 RepID=A0A9N9AJ52_9GLOM|nr:22470_t:CDS:2 [Cetraspora pellucida]
MPLFKRKPHQNLIDEKMSLMNNSDYTDTNFDVENKSLTCSFSELPHWLQDNVDVLTAIPIRFRTPEFRWFRTTLFVALGL